MEFVIVALLLVVIAGMEVVHSDVKKIMRYLGITVDSDEPLVLITDDIDTIKKSVGKYCSFKVKDSTGKRVKYSGIIDSCSDDELVLVSINSEQFRVSLSEIRGFTIIKSEIKESEEDDD